MVKREELQGFVRPSTNPTTNLNPNLDPDLGPDPDPDLDPDLSPDPDPDPDPDPCRDLDLDPDPYCACDRDPGPDPDLDPNPNSNSNPNPNPNPDPDPNPPLLAPADGHCPCHDGPYAAYMDHGLGHVFTMDLAILDPDSPLLAWSPPGNFKVVGDVPYAARILAYRELWAQVCDLIHAHGCYEDALDDATSFDQFWYSLQKGRPPYSAQYSTPSAESLAHAGEHLMVTCIDKVPSHLTVVCKHWAAEQVITHLDSPCYSKVDVESELSHYLDALDGLLERLRVEPIIPDTAPYVYPSIKVHKCVDHDPMVPHECLITARKITADVKSYHTWLGKITSAILSPVKTAITEHRHDLQLSFEAQYGYELRFLYWITAWQTVPLNLPTTVPSRLRLINCDVKQCFDNIPLEGDDGLLNIVAHPITEAYDYTGNNIYIALDADDNVLDDKSKFAATQPWTPYGRSRARWIMISLDEALEIIQLYLTSLFVMVGTTLTRQVLGIPMGGSPSSHFLDLYLDHYEYRWARAVEGLAALKPARARRLAGAMRHFYRYADDTMGIVPEWYISLMTPTADRDPDSTSWIYPLIDSDGNTILEFEIEGALTCTINFLCLTIQLGSVKRGRSSAYTTITYTPYSKATKFQFGIHRLTHWNSFTLKSVKRAAFKTLMAYAILGSTQATATTQYLKDVCDTLRHNCYPKRVILEMWEQAVHSHLYSVPCRQSLSASLPEVATAVHSYIAAMS
jgi:hypothetical protein